jgi:DNA invertase Pin-like site-specific DNA recombinase
MQWNMDHSRHNIGDVAAGYAALPKYDSKAEYAWKQLAEESKEHADYIRQHLNVTETDNPEPYDTSEDMIRDIRNNRNFVVSTANADHPIWTPQDNINFRIVHDVFGHAATEGDFGWHGENDACSTHFALSSPHAQKALATECLGQTGYAIDRGGFTDQRVGFIPGLHEGLSAANEDTPVPTRAQLMQRALYGPPKESKWKVSMAIRGRPLSQNQINQLIKDYQSGLTLREVSKKNNLADLTVRKYLALNNIQTRPTGYRSIRIKDPNYKSLTELKNEKNQQKKQQKKDNYRSLITDYLQGVHPDQLAEKYRINLTTVYSILNRNQIPRRKKPQIPKSDLFQSQNAGIDVKNLTPLELKIIRMYLEGKKINEINLSLGKSLTQNAIKKVLKKHNVIKSLPKTFIQESKWKIAQDANRMYRQHTDGAPVAETTFESIQNEDTSDEHEDEIKIINGKKWRMVRRKNNPQPDTYKDPIGGWGFYSKLLDEMEKQSWVIVSSEKATPINVRNIDQYEIPSGYAIVHELVPNFARYGVIPIARINSDALTRSLTEPPRGMLSQLTQVNHNISFWDPEKLQIVYGMEYNLNHPELFDHYLENDPMGYSQDSDDSDDPDDWESEYSEYKHPTYVESIHYNEPVTYVGEQSYYPGSRVYLHKLNEQGHAKTYYPHQQETVDNFNQRYPRLSLAVLRWMKDNLPTPIGADIVNPKLKEKAQKQDFVSLSKWKISVPPAERAKEFGEGYEEAPAPSSEEIEERYKYNKDPRGHRWQLNKENLERLYNHPEWPLESKYNVFPLSLEQAQLKGREKPDLTHWNRAALGTHESPQGKNRSGFIYINPLISPESANEALWHELQHAYQHQEERFTKELRDAYFDPTKLDPRLTDEEVARKFEEEYLKHPMEIDANLFADFMRRYPIIEESDPVYKENWVGRSAKDMDIKDAIDKYYQGYGSKRRLPLPSIKSKWKKVGVGLWDLNRTEPSRYFDTKVVEEIPVSVALQMLDLERGKEDYERENIQDLTQHITQHGILEPIIIDFNIDTNTAFVTEGNHRVQVAKQLGMEWIPARGVRNEGSKSRFKELPARWQGTQTDHAGNLYIPPHFPPHMIGLPVKEEVKGFEDGWNYNGWETKESKWKLSAKTKTRLLQDAQNLDENYTDTSDIIHTFDDGWTIRRLNTVGDAHREGELMSNCINPYNEHCLWSKDAEERMAEQNPELKEELEQLEEDYGQRFFWEKNYWEFPWHDYFDESLDNVRDSNDKYPIYSLRNPDNIPHATYDPQSSGADSAILGRHNYLPKPEYRKYWDEWFAKNNKQPFDWSRWDSENRQSNFTKQAPARSKAQFRYMQAICNGSIKPPKGMTRAQACEYVEGQSPKDLPEKKSKLDMQQEMEESLIKAGFSQKAAILIALDNMSKLSYWVDGYHATVALRDPDTDVWHMDVGFNDKLTHGGVTADYINDLGTKAMRKAVADKDSRTDYYNYHTARGLYNPVTKDFIHMSHPDFWNEAEYNFKHLDQDERDRMEAFWRQLAEQNNIELDSIRVLNNQTGHLEDLNVADLEMPEEVSREMRMRERNRPLTPWEIAQGGYDTKTGSIKEAHWIEGFSAAIINQHGKMEVAPPGMVIVDGNGNVIDEDDTWHATHWDIGGYPQYRGLYNHKTGELIHMTSPKEHENMSPGYEYLSKDEAINPLEHETYWRDAANQSNIPIRDFKLMYEKDADEYGDEPSKKIWHGENKKEDFNLLDSEEVMPKISKWKKRSHWIKDYVAAIINQNGEMEIAKPEEHYYDEGYIDEYYKEYLEEGKTLEEWQDTHWDIGGMPIYRGLYNPHTKEVVHMTSPEEYNKISEGEGQWFDWSEKRRPEYLFEQEAINPENHKNAWLEAARKSNIPISNVNLLYSKENEPRKDWGEENPESEFLIKKSKWKKKSHWLEDYYAAVITPSGKMKVSEDWNQFHGMLAGDLEGRQYHRGLYNKETGELLHMTSPEEWKKLENSWDYSTDDTAKQWPIGFEWFNSPEHFISPYKNEKEWLKAAEDAGIPVSGVKMFSGEPEGNPYVGYDVNRYNRHSPAEVAQMRMSKWKTSKEDAWEAVLDGELGHDILTTGSWGEVKKQTLKWLKQLKNGYINKKNPHDNKKIDPEAKEQDGHAIEDLKLYEEKKRWSFHFDHGKHPYDLIIQPVGYKESKWKKKSSIPRFLYHDLNYSGRANPEEIQRRINNLKINGLTPSGTETQGALSGHPEIVYLTSRKDHVRPPIVQIDTSNLDHNLFVPDDDLFFDEWEEDRSYESIGKRVHDDSELSNLENAFRSLEELQTIGYRGTIPSNAITIINNKESKWKKKSHWIEGFHAAVIDPDGKMHIAGDWEDIHQQTLIDNGWIGSDLSKSYRGLYNPDTGELFHMTSPVEKMTFGEYATSPNHLSDIENHEDVWREAASKSGVPVNDFKGLYKVDEYDEDGWRMDPLWYQKNPKEMFGYISPKQSKWKKAENKKRKTHPKFQTSLSDHQRSVKKYGPLKTHKTRKFKKRSSLNEEQSRELFQYEPHMYHDVAAARSKEELNDQINTVRSILQNGILPKEQTGVSEYDDWLTSRPDHVYLGRKNFYSRKRPPAIKIDMSKVDPSTIKPDEDIYHAFGFSERGVDMFDLKSMPFEEEHRNNPDYTLGQWMEDHSHLDTPNNVFASHGLNNSLAVKGGVPSDALSINDEWVDYMNDRYGIDILKLL